MRFSDPKETLLRQADIVPDYWGQWAHGCIVGRVFCDCVWHIANLQHGQPRDNKGEV
jgi:hypothetical protein